MSDAVHLRPLTPEDRHHLVAVLDALSPTDRYHRFLTPMPRYPERVLEALAAVDGVDHLATGAFAGDRCVGIGRCIRFPDRPTVGEVAATVVPGHRRRGLATRLLRSLAEPARRAGVDTFELVAAAENRPALALARSLGFRLAFESGLVAGTAPVDALLPARVAPAA